MLDTIALLDVLNLLNLILTAGNLLLTFSLFVYILTHNLRNSVARAFAALIGFVTIVFGADVILARVTAPEAATVWLKMQWIGIALVPAAYLHFSDALLRTTGATSRSRRLAVGAAYTVGVAFFVLAVSTRLIVEEAVTYAPWATQFTAGPFFWVFGLYFFVTSVWGFANTLWARQRTLTSTSRRRMTYLVASFAAPGMAVYPYLLLASTPARLSIPVLMGLLLIGNLGVGTMILLMAYSVAYQGALAPDRVVRHSLFTYLLRGPLLGVLVIVLTLIVPRVEVVFGLPRETVLIFAIVGGIIAYQVLLRFLQPLFDYLIYEDDRAELQLWRSLNDRLLTSGDLHQLMENIVTTLCDLLRASSGFIMVMRDGQLTVETACGSQTVAESFVQACKPAELATLENDATADVTAWSQIAGMYVHPLRDREGTSTLGVLTIDTEGEPPTLTERERQFVQQLIVQAEIALEDRRLQQSMLGLLRQLTTHMESLQRWRSEVPYPGKPLDPIEENPIFAPDFPQMVKDALGHYWGGPRLTESPLLRLEVVRRRLKKHDNNPAKALRAVLSDALEALKPEGQRTLTTQEWLLYNIIDLKYIQGKRARDVASRLAMSESDLYRKQRAAIDGLARAIAAMEQTITAQEQSKRATGDGIEVEQQEIGDPLKGSLSVDSSVNAEQLHR